MYVLFFIYALRVIAKNSHFHQHLTDDKGKPAERQGHKTTGPNGASQWQPVAEMDMLPGGVYEVVAQPDTLCHMCCIPHLGQLGAVFLFYVISLLRCLYAFHWGIYQTIGLFDSDE